MTGKELIVYILMNDLVDVDIFKDGRLYGFWTIQEAAEHFGVGNATVKTWITLGQIDYITIDTTIYIPMDSKRKNI